MIEVRSEVADYLNAQPGREGRSDGHPPAAGRSEESLRNCSGARNSVDPVPVRQGAPPGNERESVGRRLGTRGCRPHGPDGRRRSGRQNVGGPRIAPLGVRRAGRGERQGSAAAAVQRDARRAGAGRADARTRRRRGRHRAARLGQRHPDLRAVRARHRQRPHRRAGGRRRRLPDQAVRSRRVGGPTARAAAPVEPLRSAVGHHDGRVR